MSRLSGSGRVEGSGKAGSSSGLPSGVSITLLAGVAVLAVIGGIIAVAAGYSLVSSGAITFGSSSTVTTSTTTSTSSTTIATSTTSSSTSSSTTTMEAQVAATSTSTTSTTLGREAIAFCMRNRMNVVYLSNNQPSINLEQYFGDYASIFPVMDCSQSKEDKENCDADLEGYIGEEKLVLGSRTYKVPGYPVVVLSKDLTAYIVPSTSEFERLLACGSLKTP